MILLFIQLLTLLGFLISIYFVLVYHHRLPANAAWIPRFCRMEEGTCEEIVHSSDGCLLRIPNAHLGAIFYFALLLATVLLRPFTAAADGFMIALGITVGTGIYLTHSLLFVLKKNCVLCFTVHGINLLLFILLILYQ